MEPYGHHRNIAYVVVAPDNEQLLTSLRTFFRHLSCAYEQCRLGRHMPISSKLRDGILRVSKSVTDKMSDNNVDDWFSDIGKVSLLAGWNFKTIIFHDFQCISHTSLCEA